MTVHKMTQMASEHLEKQSISPAEASKLRGVAQWTDSEFLGRPAKACLMMLADRQYGTGSDMTMELRWALEYTIDVAEMAQPRHHSLACPSAPQSWSTPMQQRNPERMDNSRYTAAS